MLNISHHFNRVASGAAYADFKRLSERTQQEIALKVAAVAIGSFVGSLVMGSLVCCLSKIAGITLMLASPVMGVAAGAYALSRFAEPFCVNHVVNLGGRVLKYLDIHLGSGA